MKNKYYIEKVTWTEEKEFQSGTLDSQFYKAQDNLLTKSDSWHSMEYGIAYYPIGENGKALIQNSYRWFANEVLRDEEFENIKKQFKVLNRNNA